MTNYRQQLSDNAADFDSIIAGILAENDKLRLALGELCQIKAIKNKHGKNAEYELRQPTAWANAFNLIEPKAVVIEPTLTENEILTHDSRCSYLYMEFAECDCGVYKCKDGNDG